MWEVELNICFLSTVTKYRNPHIFKIVYWVSWGFIRSCSGSYSSEPSCCVASFDNTIPYLPSCFKTIVPCLKAILGTDNLLTTFSLSVWLTIGLVLLTTAVFWCARNGPYRYVCNETHTYQSMSSCFQNSWSFLVAVSVPQQPTTSSLRDFFFLYVCFISLLALYSKHSFFLVYWNRIFEIR